VLVATPMVHGGGLTMLVACIRFDIPMVILERFDPDAALDAVEAHYCSWMLGLLFMFAEMAKRQRVRPRRIGSLRRGRRAAGPRTPCRRRLLDGTGPDREPEIALGKVDRRAALAILLSGSISGSRG